MWIVSEEEKNLHLGHPSNGIEFKEKKNFLFNIYLFLRESARTGEGQRARETEDPSKLCPVTAEPHVGLKFTNCEITTFAEVRFLTSWATICPKEKILKAVSGAMSRVLELSSREQ